MYLIACKVLNQSTIARFVDDSLRLLCPEGSKNNHFRIFLSSYMLSAELSLKVFYPKLINLAI